MHIWEGYVKAPTGYYGAMKKLGYPWAVSGDTRMTVSDQSSARSAISVGAYTSKGSFTNISGASLSYGGAITGKIAPFSSLGPVMGNRVKPDIAGPGFGLVSGISSYDTSYGPTGDNYSSVISKTTIDGRDYSYAIAAGTSMSSPAVAGIIAMMLQMNPLLTPDSALSILARTAITDSHTGTLPTAGNNTWGHGKANAYKALKYMAQLVTVENTLSEDPLQCFLYPNPSAGDFTISYQSDKATPLTVETCDITGRIISTENWPVTTGSNSRKFSLGGVAKGLYFTKISSGSKYKVIKTMVE
jgi:hypothetical protein